jgi:hypothetical protein
MPLLDLKTDLTSLKFGKDRPGGGSSNQPFVIKDIPGVEKSFLDRLEDESTGQYGMSAANDFGFRGGFLRPGAALQDVERIFKLYTKTPVGAVFNAKQVGIGLLANPSQIWNPLTIPAQLLLNGVGAGHIPALLNPKIGQLFSDPQAFLQDFAPNAISEYGFGPEGNGLSREAFFKMGNPAVGTNNLLKGKLGETNKRNDYLKGVTTKQGVALPPDITGDTITLTPLYTSTTPSEDISNSDMIKFVISIVDNDDPTKRTWIHFRAYLDSFSDSYGANWNSTQYVGRGEQFYTYGGFSRDISLGFRVAVQSKGEQKPLYEKLTYLASTCAPDYSNDGFMRGNLMYLTVGDYLVDVPGVLKGISFGGFEESPWEIARKPDGTIDPDMAQLPQTLTVSGFSFSPIHNFVPRTGAKFIGYDKSKGDILIDKSNAKPEDGISIENFNLPFISNVI